MRRSFRAVRVVLKRPPARQGMENCVLCQCEFDTLSKKKKRKLLHGTSCAAELSILKCIISSKRVVLTEVSELALRNKNAFLCGVCQKSLLRCQHLEKELLELMSSICAKIGVTGKAMYDVGAI